MWMTLYTFILIVLTTACWHVLKSMALWEHHSKHRLHHFPTRWPGRLEFIIICAVVEGNKKCIVVQKEACFVPPFAFATAPTWGRTERGRNGRLLWVSNIKVPVKQYAQTIHLDPQQLRGPKRTRPLTRSLASKMGEVWNRSTRWYSLHLAVRYHRNRQAVQEKAHHSSQALILHNYSINSLLLLGYNILFFFFFTKLIL